MNEWDGWNSVLGVRVGEWHISNLSHKHRHFCQGSGRVTAGQTTVGQFFEYFPVVSNCSMWLASHDCRLCNLIIFWNTSISWPFAWYIQKLAATSGLQQASQVFIVESNLKVKMSAEHWLNADRGTLKYSEKILPHCHFVTTDLTWTGKRSSLLLDYLIPKMKAVRSFQMSVFTSRHGLTIQKTGPSIFWDVNAA
jgi:hypothetical protein